MAMEVSESTDSLPTDVLYIESLDEPLKSIARSAIPPKDSEDPLPSASSRLDKLEIDVRSQLLELCYERKIEDIGNFWRAALDLCYHIVYHAAKTDSVDARYENMAARKLPLLLIEDCLDGLSIKNCQILWLDFVEPALDEILLKDLFWNDPKHVCHLPMLRVCNQFLRVLGTGSCGNEQEWKGRILCALSKGFSVADRSAFKHWGTFHSANVNEYESKEEFENSAAADENNSQTKYNLYEAFWSLQADFSNPNRIQVGEFIKKMRLILAAFESSTKKRSDVTKAPSSTALRYMTSSSLLPTQLATPTFRSSVISQFLIVASHLSSESAPLANALRDLISRARKLLKVDNAPLYAVLWDSILSDREVQWRQWKKDKCPAGAFAPKRAAAKDHDEDMKSKRSRLLAGALESNSNDDAKKVFESIKTDDLIKISQEMVKAVPNLEQHLETYVEALDPEAGIEDEYHPKNDALFTWRAMRLFAKHQLPHLKQCRKPADLERMTRTLYESRGQEIPGEMPPPDEISDEAGSEDEDSKSSNSSDSEDQKLNDDGDDSAEGNGKQLNDMDDEEDGEDDEEAEKSNVNEDDEMNDDKADQHDPEGDKDNDNDVQEETDEMPSPKSDTESKNPDEMNLSVTKSDADKATMDVDGGNNTKSDSKGNNVSGIKRDRDDDKRSGPDSEDEGEVEGSGKKGNGNNQPGPSSRSSSHDRSALPPRESVPREGNRRRDDGPPPPKRGRRDEVVPPRSRHEDAPPRGNRRDDDGPPRGGRRDDSHRDGQSRGGRRDADHRDRPSRGGRRDDDGPSRAGRRDDGPPRGGRREDIPSRGGRRDDIPPRGGRRDDIPPRGGRRDDGPSRGGPPRGGRRPSPPRGGRGGDRRRGGGGGGGGGGREDGRYNGRRHR